MKAINIKWDVTDGTEDITKKEMDEMIKKSGIADIDNRFELARDLVGQLTNGR